MIYFENTFMYTGFNPISKHTFLIFKKMSKEEHVKLGYQKLLEVYTKYGCGYHLTDTRKMGVVSPKAQEYVYEHILPKMIEHTEHSITVALIVGKDIFAQFAAKNISIRAYNTVKSAFFDELEKGETWLSEQQQIQDK